MYASDTARLVLGYLSEKGLEETKNAFSKESPDLLENPLDSMFNQGLRLSLIVEEYLLLRANGRKKNPADPETVLLLLWKQFDVLVGQLKHTTIHNPGKEKLKNQKGFNAQRVRVRELNRSNWASLQQKKNSKSLTLTNQDAFVTPKPINVPKNSPQCSPSKASITPKYVQIRPNPFLSQSSHNLLVNPPGPQSPHNIPVQPQSPHNVQLVGPQSSYNVPVNPQIPQSPHNIPVQPRGPQSPHNVQLVGPQSSYNVPVNPQIPQSPHNILVQPRGPQSPHNVLLVGPQSSYNIPVNPQIPQSLHNILVQPRGSQSPHNVHLVGPQLSYNIPVNPHIPQSPNSILVHPRGPQSPHNVPVNSLGPKSPNVSQIAQATVCKTPTKIVVPHPCVSPSVLQSNVTSETIREVNSSEHNEHLLPVDNLKSPKRKSVPPRKRTGEAAAVLPQVSAKVTQDDGQLVIQSVLDKILGRPELPKKMAENINRAVEIDAPTSQQSGYNTETENITQTQSAVLDGNKVNDILEMMKSDPVFEELFSSFETFESSCEESDTGQAIDNEPTISSKPSSSFFQNDQCANVALDALLMLATSPVRPQSSYSLETPKKSIASPSNASPIIASPCIASPSIASQIIASPCIASPCIASPSIASQIIASPCIASPCIASKDLNSKNLPPLSLHVRQLNFGGNTGDTSQGTFSGGSNYKGSKESSRDSWQSKIRRVKNVEIESSNVTSSEDRSYEWKSPEDKSSGRRSSEDKSSDRRSSEGKSSEGKSSERSSEDKSSERKCSDDKSSERRSSEDKSSERKGSEDNSSERRCTEDKSSERRSSENKSSEDKSCKGKSSDVIPEDQLYEVIVNEDVFRVRERRPSIEGTSPTNLDKMTTNESTSIVEEKCGQQSVEDHPVVLQNQQKKSYSSSEGSVKCSIVSSCKDVALCRDEITDVNTLGNATEKCAWKLTTYKDSPSKLSALEELAANELLQYQTVKTNSCENPAKASHGAKKGSLVENREEEGYNRTTGVILCEPTESKDTGTKPTDGLTSLTEGFTNIKTPESSEKNLCSATDYDKTSKRKLKKKKKSSKTSKKAKIIPDDLDVDKFLSRLHYAEEGKT